MWMLYLAGTLSAHEGHDHDGGTGGIGLMMLPEVLCEAQWPNMADASEPLSRRCYDYFLPFAYPRGFNPEMSPTYGDPVEQRLSIAGLQQILVHLQDTCHVDEPVEDAACFRAGEFFQGLLDRKMAVHDNGARFDLLLEKALAGQPLAESELSHWSPMTMWKLQHAVYARHGKDFDNPDLNAFFYGERAEPIAGLPLTKTAPETINLTDIDQQNLTRIRAVEQARIARSRSNF
jgi:hypothetical protein